MKNSFISFPPNDEILHNEAYIDWCNLNQCQFCKLIRHEYYMYRVPCQNCGEITFKRVIGKWNTEKEYWQLADNAI